MRFIRQTILSCLAQATEGCRLEVIVVNDGSTDNTAETARGFPARVRLVSYQENRGRNYARNKGLASARGKYVKFLDHDDLLEPHTLHKEFRAAKEQDADIVVAGHRIIQTGDNESSMVVSERKEAPIMNPRIDAVLAGRAVPTAAALYRRSYIDGLSWDSQLPRLDDWDFFVRAALRMGKIVNLKHVSYSWRHHSKHFSSQCSLLQYAIDHHRILGKIETCLRDRNLLTADRRKRLAQYYYKMLRVFCRHDRSLFYTALQHIQELDSSFFPYAEKQRLVRSLCLILGTQRGLMVYDKVALSARTLLATFGKVLPMGVLRSIAR